MVERRDWDRLWSAENIKLMRWNHAKLFHMKDKLLEIVLHKVLELKGILKVKRAEPGY